VTLNNKEIDPAFMIGMTVDVVAAYLSNNPARAFDVPELIAATHAALAGLGMPAAAPEPEKQLPAVAIKKSVSDDYLISLEDGKRYKSLKRHLSGKGLSPDQYRAKWGLPLSYPMVAPSYAKQRSELARSMGLGRKAVATEAAPVPAAAPAKRGRPRKA
jgi:predicted transcriptional regulator